MLDGRESGKRKNIPQLIRENVTGAPAASRQSADDLESSLRTLRWLCASAAAPLPSACRVKTASGRPTGTEAPLPL